MAKNSIDLFYLKNISMGNREFELKLLQTFVEQTDIEMKIIQESLQRKDWDALYASAHKIKPSLHFIGGLQTEALLKSIEGIVKDKINLEKLPELVSDFLKSCIQVIKEVKVEIENYQNSSKINQA